jgi:RNA polymerase sigma factor (sigma-70 family)
MANNSAGTLVQHIRRLAGATEPGQASDAQLLDRFAREGDGDAFAALVQRHGPMVLRVCRRLLRDHHAAQDAFQATFLVLARRARAVGRAERLAGWLYGVAYRVASQARAREAARLRREAGAPARPVPDAAAEAAARELSAAVDDELNRLPERYRAPLFLCYLEGRTRDEAARQLGVSLRTLQRRLEAGRVQLRARLTRRGLTLGAALVAASVAGSTGAALSACQVSAARAAAAGAATPAAAGLADAALRTTARMSKLAAAVLLGGILAVAAGVAACVAVPLKPPAKSPAADDTPKPAPPPDKAAAPADAPRFDVPEKNVRLAYSPDGRYLVTGGPHGDLRVWDAAAGRQVAAPTEKPARVGEIAFSADGKLFATASNDDLTVRVWDAATGRVVRKWDDNDAFKSVAFSPDGKTLASGNLDEEVLLWEIATGKLLRKWRAHRACISVVRFTPDGKELVSGDLDEPLYVWDLESGKKQLSLGCLGEQRMFDLSRDGRLVAWLNGEGHWPRAKLTVRVTDLATGKNVQVLHKVEEGGADFRGALAFAPDGKTLAGGLRDTIYLWDAATGKELRRWVGDRRMVTSLAFAGDGKTLASSGLDSTIRLWDPATGKELSATSRPDK